ncbi:hypothetical protein EW145_g3726 [Phellinidium pouzarii]|uniref:LCCL domain-containing protein n=1 Tax=Phellinidium pouzarii TaxID=167371 RepID=A0A4S4L6C1_9AGAM|nr:hypothetical protein EW145_g3726 [Phellinidium pouzarii]
MAAPLEVNTLDLSGTYVMNKTLSDDPDEILRLQGISWIKRKLIASITITLYVKHYKDDEGIEHIDITQIGTGGFGGNREERILTWQVRSVDDPVFGPVVGKSRRIMVEDIEDNWHKEGWLPDTAEQGNIESLSESDTPKTGTTWIADQIWGFAEINGERRYTRRVHFTGPGGEDIKAVLTYDYNPVPVLNRSYRLANNGLTLALEPALLRWTRSFSSKWLLAGLVAAYIISFAFLTRSQYYLIPASSWAGCTSTYWLANDGCGLDGQTCGPFDNSSLNFRCPAQCHSVILANPRTIGNIQVVGVPLVVGGGDEDHTYRGDSFVCSAAVHAGLFKDSTGGCGSLELVGNFTNFLSLTAHGLTSAPFPTVFPLSLRYGSTSPFSHCSDLRNYALAFNIIVTALLFLLLMPRPIFLYWSLVCIGFWHVSLFSQPQDYPPALDVAFQGFLPTLFVAYAFWRLAFRFTLPAFSQAPLERSVWYLAAFWPGVLLNIVTEKMPIDRLVASDIDGNKGALTAVIILVVIVFVIVINQIRVIRKTGWLPHYLAWYIAGGLVALVLSQLPGLQLRLHHYIFAMVMIPGTGFPTRLSAIYQSFLLGMFLNGIAAFGFDSILQTAADLRRDAAQGSALPSFITNSTTYNMSLPLSNQSIFWNAIPDSKDGWDGFALLVDDVERYTGTALNFSLAALQEGIPHFFRLAFQSEGTSGDFTRAATLWPNGTWVDPLPGKWSCSLCWSPKAAHRGGLSPPAALRHEKSAKHKEKVREHESWNPQPGIDAWINGIGNDYDLCGARASERMQHVDQLKDLIPFWREQIEAAERGETLRYEEFLDALARKTEEKERDEPVWNVPMPDWALEPMDGSDVPASPSDGEAFTFVEKIANMNRVSAERKKGLHNFYKIPTGEKLERIQELINVLRTTQMA